MGWWWSSGPRVSDSPTDTAPPASTPLPTQDSTSSRIFEEAAAAASNATPVPEKSLTREDKANQEFAQFLADFEAEEERARAEAAKRRQASSSSSDNNDAGADQNSGVASRIRGFASQFKQQQQRSSDADGTSTQDQDASNLTLLSATDPSNISFEALASEDLTCRTAFDYAFYCQSMGGQFTNVYRHGELRACSHLWDEFWLCMRTKSYPDERRRKAIKQHNIEKLKRWRSGPSSEDIWDVRDKLDLDSPEPFRGDLAKLERETEEWKKRTGNTDVKL